MKQGGPYIAAIEGGGTSFKVAVCKLATGEIVERLETDSANPVACLVNVSLFLQEHGPYAAAGIATFGPVGCKPGNTATFGTILKTSPKAAWRGVDFLTPIQNAVGKGVPVLVDTDVNAPAWMEFNLANKKIPSITSCAYVTVGTGVGVGLVVNGRPVHGAMHPEGGHVPVQALPGDVFAGYSWGKKNSNIPFEGVHTVEGLSSSVSLTERWQEALQQAKGGTDARTSSENVTQLDRDVLKTLPDDCEVWDHSANALAQLCATLMLTLSIEKIVLGGGLLRRTILLDKIRARTIQVLNGYLDLSEDIGLKRTITTSVHGDDAGLQGAISLAQRAAQPNASDANTRQKQVAFSTGLWHGFLVGAIGTALVFKYGVFGIGGRSNRR